MARRTTGRIFNIQRYSIHDGAGIRTLVFLKGCPLQCPWCSNPESRRSSPELGFIEARCVSAGTCGAPCVAACAPEAIELDEAGRAVIRRERCNACGECEKVCGPGALKVVGREMTVEEVLKEVEKDRPFYRRSGGGLTIGGGEPLAQHRFTAELLEAAQEEYLHTAIETSGHAPWEHFEKVVRRVDLLHCDLKHMDPERHRELTGQTNERILGNLRKVATLLAPRDVVIRIPLIPGRNDSVENLEASARFLAECGLEQIELIPYHRWGVSKYRQYGMVYELEDLEPAREGDVRALRDVVEGFGLQEVTGRL